MSNIDNANPPAQNTPWMDSLLRRSPFAVIVTRMSDGVVLDANARTEALFGYTPEEYIGRSTLDLNVWVDPQDRARYIGMLRDREDLSGIEARLRAKDGSVGLFSFAIQKEVVQQETCVVTYIFRVTRDEEAERPLRLAQERLAALLHMADMTDASESAILAYAVEQAAALTDSDNGYLYFINADEQTAHLAAWSPAHLTYEREAAASLFLLEKAGAWADAARLRRPVIHNPYPTRADCLGLPDALPQITRHLSVPVLEKDHLVALAGVCNKPDPYESNDAAQLFLLMEGVWQLLRRRHSELAHETILRTAMDSFYMTDLQGRFLEVNDAYCNLVGYTCEELMQMSVADIEGAEAPVEIEQRGQAMQQNIYNRFESRHRRKDGRLVDVEVSAQYTHMFGGRVFVFIRDISSRKASEHIVENIARGVSSATGETFFRELVGYLARTLNVDFAIVGETTDASLSRINTIAVHAFGEDADNFMYDTEKAPCWHIFQHSLSIFAEDVQKDFPQAPLLKQMNIYSYAGVPLTGSDGSILGVMIVMSCRPLENPGLARSLFQIFAARASAEMERARREEALRLTQQQLSQRVEELEAVNRISTALRITRNLDEMLPILIDETIAILNAQSAIILLVDEEKKRITKRIGRGWLDEATQNYSDPQIGFVGQVLNSGQSLSTSPANATDQFITPPLASEGWTGLIVPILALKETIGVLNVAIATPRELTTPEVHLIETLAEIAGNAIQRTRLHERTELSLSRLATLHEIDVAIASNLDLRRTMAIILDFTLKTLPVDAVDLLLLDPNTQTLEYADGKGFHTYLPEHTPLKLDRGVIGQAIHERRQILTNDLPFVESTGPREHMVRSEGFVGGCATPMFSKGQLIGVLEIFQRAPLNLDAADLEFFEMLAGQMALGVENLRLFERMQRSHTELLLAYNETIEGWSRAMDLRDKETDLHTHRVTELTLRLAQLLGISGDELVHIRRGALLHDIGKMGVPDAILNKPGPLTNEEWTVMRRHPQFAYDMISPIRYLRQALDIPYYHHERWDGSGYPHGLKGADIPLAARIFAVVDVWDALRNDRPYRPAWSKEDALDYIRKHAGTFFDPEVVQAFMSLASESI